MGLESNIGSEGTQPIPNLQEVQNAVPQVHSGQRQKGRLPLLHRPDRDLPSCFCQTTSPQIPPFLLWRQTLSVQGSPLRSILSTSGIHEDTGSISGLSQTDPGKSTMLPGRYNYPVQFIQHCTARSTNYNRDTSETWLFCEFQKEPHYTYHSDLTSGRDDRFKPMQGLSLPGTQGQHQISSSQDPEGEGSPTCPAIATVGENDFLPRNNAVGQTSLQTSPMVPTPLPEVEHQCFHTEGESSTLHSALTQMVGVTSHTQGVSFQGASQTHPDHGHQSVWLGSSHTDIHDTGSMVQTRSRTQHKLARTQGNTPGSSPILQHSDRESCSGND
ncbi:uncharacterized protein LOC120297788 isoform X1 [Crotalus tigris]|uniref:uncharacterized protein LOC120297788 isoform X1 n=1 Tax=Crotalus tigris TaxID=88082 RepID=UPI00192F6453|nr:uncharacterized protein LOC120297788 isoform X1 [Crotalus tigris]